MDVSNVMLSLDTNAVLMISRDNSFAASQNAETTLSYPQRRVMTGTSSLAMVVTRNAGPNLALTAQEAFVLQIVAMVLSRGQSSATIRTLIGAMDAAQSVPSRQVSPAAIVVPKVSVFQFTEMGRGSGHLRLESPGGRARNVMMEIPLPVTVVMKVSWKLGTFAVQFQLIRIHVAVRLALFQKHALTLQPSWSQSMEHAAFILDPLTPTVSMNVQSCAGMVW